MLNPNKDQHSVQSRITIIKFENATLFLLLWHLHGKMAIKLLNSPPMPIMHDTAVNLYV